MTSPTSSSTGYQQVARPRQQPVRKSAAGRALHIAVVLFHRGMYGHRLAAGIAEFSRSQPHWHTMPLFSRSLLVKPHNLKADGAIVWFDDAGYLAKDVPRVVIDGNFLPSKRIGVIGQQMDQVAALAASHLIELGLKHCTFIGPQPRGNVRPYQPAMARHVEQLGATFIPCPLTISANEAIGENWNRDIVDLAQWLCTLPSPLGVAAYNDAIGYRILRACAMAGKRVPDDVALLGIDNDEVICNLSDPPLSSIDPNARRIGYQAAALLCDLLDGRGVPPVPVDVAPAGVVHRRSTDLLAVEDPHVAAALRFIREAVARPIDVKDVQEQVSISRRSLERRFKSRIGRSIQAEIRRVRITHARHLLASTNLTISQVAEQCGYTSAKYFSVAFKATVGIPPSDYRQQ